MITPNRDERLRQWMLALVANPNIALPDTIKIALDLDNTWKKICQELPYKKHTADATYWNDND